MMSPLSNIDKILDKHSVTKCNLYLKQFCISVIINKIIESIRSPVYGTCDTCILLFN